MKNKIDAFMVSAVFEHGDSIDNDKVAVKDSDMLEKAVQDEIAETSKWHDGKPTAFLVTYYSGGEIVDSETVENARGLYKVIDSDGYALLITDDVPTVVDALNNGARAYAVLKLGEDGEYHIDKSDW